MTTMTRAGDTQLDFNARRHGSHGATILYMQEDEDEKRRNSMVRYHDSTVLSSPDTDNNSSNIEPLKPK